MEQLLLADPPRTDRSSSLWLRVELPGYVLALLVSVSLWFLAFHAPLTDDETGSFWQISQGFWKILSRQGGLSFPTYAYILWFFSKILGTSEPALRVPSILAMAGAVCFLYGTARKLFDTGVALIVTIIFCLHPVVMFAAIDVRPYAFAALAINAAIFALICLRESNSNWLAALLGFVAACIVYFHFLFTLILPVFAICFFVVKVGDRKVRVRQLIVAVVTFGVAILPTTRGLLFTFQTRSTHVYDVAPNWMQLAAALAPGWLIPIAFVVAFMAAATKRLNFQRYAEGWRVYFCLLLGIVPILILYGVSIVTSIHIFLDRYHLVAIPGIALCWGLMANWFDSRLLKMVFCLALVATSAMHYFHSPEARHHLYSWKDALHAAEDNASLDNAPVLICSEFVESHFVPMPLDSPKESKLFAQLSYYKLSVPVIPLPQELNQETVRVVLSFLQRPTTPQQRFLAMAYEASYPTLNWVASRASGTHYPRVVGVFDGVAVLEFKPIQK